MNNVNEAIFVKKELKRQYAAQNHILIDDYLDNIKEWREDGGIGILHVTVGQTIKELKQLGL